MHKFLQSKESVSFCYKNTCIHVKGTFANLFAIGTLLVMVICSLNTLSKSI